MYYKERIIDGDLYYQTSPYGTWRLVDPEIIRQREKKRQIAAILRSLAAHLEE